jgi:dolichol-phosphate mannosyltransferase
MPNVSIVIPAHNEAENLALLGEELNEMMLGLHDTDFEVVLVDDGSLDASVDQMRRLASKDSRYRLLRHRRRAGQSAALISGFGAARGDVVVTLDADLQNPPGEIPKLLLALDGFDLVSGHRVDRSDSWMVRAAGKTANRVRGWVLRDGVRDVGCSLKAYRREVLVNLPEFDGLHRFLPAVLRARGARIVEVSVKHRPRAHGQSHYTILGRLWRGVFDLAGVVWLIKRSVHHRDVRKERVK